MRRFKHPKGWAPRPGQPFHFSYWDRCGCGYLQHYEAAKVHKAAPKQPVARPLTPDQQRAAQALRQRCPGESSRMRREWLAEQMGIEERYAIISQFDAVECDTVVQICAEPRSE